MVFSSRRSSTSKSAYLLKIEDVNYVPDKDGKPTTQLRTIHGFAISSKRCCLREGSKIVEVKGHGLGYLMSPSSKEGEDWMVDAWQYVLQVDAGEFIDSEPDWLDRPAMMKIPVSSPAVLGRLKGFCKPYDFVRAPIVRDCDLDPDSQSDKPILIARFSKHPEEWLHDTYYNVRTGEECRITTGESKDPRVVPVRTYREILRSGHISVSNATSDIVAALRNRRKPAPDPIPTKGTKSGWKIVVGIGAFVFAVGLGILAALDGVSAPGSDYS
jgi:hypothetical protein